MDAEGAVASVASVAFEYYGGGANPWKSLGKGWLYDNLLTTFFGPDENTSYDPQIYEVEILENSDEPGMYRIVNAFQSAAEYMGYSNYYTPTNIDVNATVADGGVYITSQQTGLGGYAISTYGGYMLQNYDFETLYQYGYFGTLKDGVMTFPIFSRKDNDGNVQFTYQGMVTTPDAKNYYSGINPTADTQLKIVLPSAAASVKAAAKRSAKAASFAKRLHSYVVKNQKVVKKDKFEATKLATKVKKQNFKKGF
jgi:hypothetical protein